MKSLIKFFPVAVGVLALASCSNDDFFGSSNEDGKLKLVATVAAPAGSDDGLSTRSVIAPAEAVADYQNFWQAGDKFRVYDAALQKYDAFSFKAETGNVTIDTESPKVTEYSKAIFPGDAVSYAGWSADNDAVTATVKINDVIDYSTATSTRVKVDSKTAYLSNIPMWGNVTMKEDHIGVDLQPLVSYLDITVYGGASAAKYIRVISAAEGKTNADFQGTYAAAITTGLSTTAPLTGYFDALLKNDYTDSYLVANKTAPLAEKYGYVIKVNLTNLTSDEFHVIVPIVAQTYESLIIQSSTTGNADSWTQVKAFPANTVVPNNNVIRKDLLIGTAISTQEAKVSKFEDIQTRLDQFLTDNNTATVLNISLANGVAPDAIKTSDGNQTITIKDYQADKIINLNFDIDDTDYNLTIDNDNSKATVLNLQTIKGNMPVTIKQGAYDAAKVLTITGEINSTGSGENKRLVVAEQGNLILGLGAWGPFKSNMNLYLTGTINNSAALTIAAGDGSTIAAIDASAAENTSNIDVVSGTVTAIGEKTAAATPVTVEGAGKVTTLKTKGGNVTIQNGGNVTTTAVKDAATVTVGSNNTDDAVATATTITAETGDVTIKANAIVTDITTGNANATINAAINSLTSAATTDANTPANSRTITATANIGTLNLSGVAPGITLTGATEAAKDVVKIENLKTTVASTKQTVKLTSTNKAAVGTVTFAKTDDSVDATSSITVANAADVKTTYIGSANEIYTAAQLAGVTTGKAYKLCTNVTAPGKWTPLNISKNFSGNNKKITGLNAPLFGTISGGTVKELELEDVTVASKAANQGALAQVVDGTVTIEKITVSGTSTIGAAMGNGDDYADANSKNIGGLVGKAKGTVTLTNNKVTATIQGYANVGGYIGNFESGTVTMTVDHASSYKSTVTLNMTYKPAVADNESNANYGTFGYFIGSITGTSEVAIKKKDTNKGDRIGHYFDTTNPSLDVADDTDVDKLCFARNRKIENNVATKWFTGMTNHEFGYSTGSIAEGELVLYTSDSDTDLYGNPIENHNSINTINQWTETNPYTPAP